MLYKEMIPAQIRDAVAANNPVALCIGNLEFHSEHLPIGTDGQVTEGILNLLEKKHPELVLLPPFYYGTSSYAVAGPENGQGTVSVDSMLLTRFAENLFSDLLETGFRNIHGFFYHQSENAVQGMPMDLAFKFAGRRAIFGFLERTRGRGWWGKAEMANYYDDNNVFDWIQIHRVVDPDFESDWEADHAGKVETSAIMALHPDLVHMDKWTTADWFAESAPKASRGFGEKYIADAVAILEKKLFPKN